MHRLLLLLVLLSVGCKKENPRITELDSKWEFQRMGDTAWLKATVPGTVHTDLLDNKKIQDPFYRLNELQLQWIDKSDWVYQSTFYLTEDTFEKDNHLLVFEGLDTYANIYLNNTLLLQTDNMFRTFEVDVKALLQEGKNRIQIVLESPIKKGLEKYDKLPYTIPVSDNDLAELGQVEGNKKVSVFSRKAGYHFGWDWGPRLVTSGIWRPVVLKSWNNFIIRDVFVTQKITDSIANLNAQLEIQSYEEVDLDLEIVVDGETKKKEKLRLENGISKNNFSFEIKNPELWWPNGLGEQKRYDITFRLSGSKSKDEISKKIGLRTVELITQKDSIGSSFYFEVNGQPTFMKGANYIPNDIFLPRVEREDYARLIDAAVDANMNMLRVWGGGVYEDDYFYELCDERGLLVWQDFMFACAMFPGDDEFLENVRQEAIDNVKRLRNHPSIALWCGNNEILAAWKGWGWEKEMIQRYGDDAAEEVYSNYKRIFHEILPDVVATYDDERRYWASSPSSALGVPESLTDGDRHYWGVWWGKEPFSNFENEMPRFMSEFGFQSFPELSTVEKYTIPEDYDIYSEVMKSHQRSSIGNETIEEYMLRHYKKPKDFESYLYVSHLLQANGIGEGIRAHRTNRARCMGSLYWQINDCWPVASWSGIDYFGKWKALHYEVKRAFAPVALHFTKNEEGLNLMVLNDNLESVPGTVEVQLLDFNGKSLKNWSNEISATPNSAQIAITLENRKLKGFDPFNMLLHAQFKIGTDIKAEAIHYGAPIKELVLPMPELNYKILEKEDSFEVVLIAKNFAKNVYLASRSTNNFSDNYFDLIPGQVKKVSIERDSSNIDFKKDLGIFTLLDTY